jgi:hypothetical protein
MELPKVNLEQWRDAMAYPGAVDANPGAMEAHTGAVTAPLGALEDFLFKLLNYV